jgi:3',5'-cyclic AMP phosphodiesterase CpdA
MSTTSISRRHALRCLACGSAGTLFALSGGVLTPIDIATAAADPTHRAAAQDVFFIQVSDTHIGFNKEANPDVSGTLATTVDLVNQLRTPPALILHTGDITHRSRPQEFEQASELLGRLHVTELHTVPGEHDTADENVSEYFDRFGQASGRKGYYSFDHSGVHFMALTNVLEIKEGGLGSLGEAQLAWARADLAARSASTPIVVFAHMPLWSVYEPWGWATRDAEPLIAALRRFGSVTVLNGHIHQIVQKTEGNIMFHSARSTAYPQPRPGEGSGPGPLTVPHEELAHVLGITRIDAPKRTRAPVLHDTSLA